MGEPGILSLDQVILALEAAIDEGAWTQIENICGHCFYVGYVYEANPDIIGPLPEYSTASCKECLVHRALWNTYLSLHP